jgi:guanylate kinase
LNKGRLIAFSAPSGTGKSTICTSLLGEHKSIKLSISATTRQPRGAEVHGKEYYFLSHEKFEEYIENNEVVEYEEVHGNFYGTLKSEVFKRIDSGNDVLFDIDVKGALTLKEKFPEAILIFIKPPSLEILEQRLRDRKTETEEQIKKRLSRVEMEMKESEKFDFVIINDILEEAIKEIEKILKLR